MTRDALKYKILKSLLGGGGYRSPSWTVENAIAATFSCEIGIAKTALDELLDKKYVGLVQLNPKESGWELQLTGDGEKWLVELKKECPE